MGKIFGGTGLATSLLIPVTTMTSVARTVPFVARDHFVVDTKYGARVRISHVDDAFNDYFLDMVEQPSIEPSVLCYASLSEWFLDAGVIHEIGGLENASTTLTDFFHSMEVHEKGGNGPLLTDGRVNFSYIRDAKETFRPVYNFWQDNGWALYADQTRDEIGWDSGSQVCYRCPNLRFPSVA